MAYYALTVCFNPHVKTILASYVRDEDFEAGTERLSRLF